MSNIEHVTRELNIQRKARQLAETQLEEKSRALYKKNQALEDALRKLKEQQQMLIAHEKQASIGQLAAGLAHEINNPNAFVRSNLDSLSQYLDALSKTIHSLITHFNDADPNYIEQIKKDQDLEYIFEDSSNLIQESVHGTLRIQRIVQGLRYFTNPTFKDKKSFDINSCITHTVQLLKHDPDISMEVSTTLEPIPDYQGLPTLLSLAIGNILKNATQSSPKSNVVHISSQLANNEVYIKVVDDGIGINPDDKHKIFDPFYSTKDTNQGLGLAISQAIVGQHNGTIDVKSDIGIGTEVCIRLPLFPS